MNLIADTGIQYITIPLQIDLGNDSVKPMYFYESYTEDGRQLKLEVVHKFQDDEIYVRKRALVRLGCFTDPSKIYGWKDIKKRFEDEFKKADNERDEKRKMEKKILFSTINPVEDEDDGTDLIQMKINKCSFEKFENWLPFPFFEVKVNERSHFAAINWCRFKLIPDTVQAEEYIKKYNLLLAFDTRAIYKSEGYEDEDLEEKPVFKTENSKVFALCDDEFSLVDFCTKHIYKNSAGITKEVDCEWVDELLLKYFHKCTKAEFERKILKKPKMNYMAQFVYLIKYIRQLDILPKITLYRNGKNVTSGDVDLLLDIGNSRTCAVLFDDSIGKTFKNVMPLGLQNFSNPIANRETIEIMGKNISIQETVENGKIKEGKIAEYQLLKLNRHRDSFDMRLAFCEADFGGCLKKGSSQFTWPSMVRLGIEANDLIYKAVNQNTELEIITTFSSPKRFLWDKKPQQKEWQFVKLREQDTSKNVRIKGISEQLNADGSLNTSGTVEIDKKYSRKALMTFCFIEIFAQAKMQINSYEFRHNWGNEDKPRKIGRIIVTCPTAMSRKEQIALRECAEDAAIILNRFYTGINSEELDEKNARNNVNVIPSSIKLQKTEERNEYIYDEATCAQFVYLYAELTERYKKNCKEYFDFYGKERTDLGNYKKKSLTIGSVDIGAGTTDVMIATYKYDAAGQCKLTPVPLFWESFYSAGDDLLKKLIRELVIEGPNTIIQKPLIAKGSSKNVIAEKIHDFFAPDNARQNKIRRQIRSEFNLQISVPIVSYFLELLKENKESTSLHLDDIFKINKPTKRVIEHFEEHFGLEFKDLQLNYDKDIVSKIVQDTFDSLVEKISAILSYYGCDIVLLSGRPTSLKPLADLFLKYYAVSPNRLITLNNYRIGTWYPFQNGNGYIKDAKSIVAIGAMIGFYACKSGLNGFSLDFSDLIKKMLPTTEYFAKSEHEQPFITPKKNNDIIEVSHLPLRIWTRQLNSERYPTRPFYMLNYKDDKIKEKIENEIPFKFSIIREYTEDKETLKIESVESYNNGNKKDLSPTYFSLQVQSMIENENYWLDTGEFVGLNP